MVYSVITFAMVAMNDFEQMLRDAKAGDLDAISRLSGVAEEYLRQSGKARPSQTIQHRFGHSDAIQDSLLTVFSRLDTFKGTTETQFLAWVKMIARNVVIDEERVNHAEKRSVGKEEAFTRPIADDQPTPSKAAMFAEAVEQAEVALEDLPEEQRIAIRLKHESGMKLAEIARAMGKSESAVGGLIRRGLETLRKGRRS